MEQPGLLEEDGAASREGAVAAGKRRNQRAKGSGRSLFFGGEDDGEENGVGLREEEDVGTG